MTAPVKDLTTDRGATGASSGAGDETTLAELRKNVRALAEEVSRIAEKRTRAARETAQAGTDALRRSIRRQPMVAIGVATVAGALLALLVPRNALHKRQSQAGWGAWAPQVTRADLYDVAHTIQRSVARATSAVPLTSTFERLVDAVAKVEPNTSLNALIDKAGTWLRRAQSSVSQAKN